MEMPDELYDAFCSGLEDYFLSSLVVGRENSGGETSNVPSEGSAAYYWLIYLYVHLGKPVLKDELALFSCYQKHRHNKSDKPALDQQIRQLSTLKGFYLLKENKYYPDDETLQVPVSCYVLYSVTEPKPGWNSSRRNTRLSIQDFDEIKQTYDYHCVTCQHFGRETIENEFIEYYPNRKCQLQQGHMNPNLPLSMDNCIPQCQNL